MSTELLTLIFGAVLNLITAVLIVRFIYYPGTQDKNYVFTFLAFDTIIYFVLGLLTSNELSVGVGFGLFAIFSVLRYRTDEMPIREMTYLFIIIALPVMNSILVANGRFLELLLINGFIVLLLYGLEKEWGFRFEASKRFSMKKLTSSPLPKQTCSWPTCASALACLSNESSSIALIFCTIRPTSKFFTMSHAKVTNRPPPTINYP